MGVSTDTQHELTRRADLLSSLLKAPGWQFMEEEIDRKIARLQKTAQNIVLQPPGTADWDFRQNKIDTIRGTIAALQWIRGVPRHAESTLQRFLEEQGITESIEGDE